MSEARHEEFQPDPEKQRIAEELRSVQAIHFLRHNQALLDDALQRQALSSAEAKSKGLKFVDIYTQETSVKVPQDRALSVLVTPGGDWLRPTAPKPHFFVYFSTMEGLDNRPGSTKGLVNWIERVKPDGSSTLFTITLDEKEDGSKEGGVQPTVTDTDVAVAIMLDQLAPTWLSPMATRDLLEEVKSYRLAPQEHAPVA